MKKEIDEKYMRRCLQLAACGCNETRPNPMVGAVIVADDRIIGEGYHVRCGEGHAEVNAFASVSAADEKLLPDATIYVSLEPCSHYGKTPPCADLIISKGVRRVVVGCVDSFASVKGRGIERIRAAGIEVTTGIMEEECRWLNRRFFTFHEKGRPYIILKWAQTADGFLDDHGCAVTISTPFTQMLVHKLRAEEDAIVVGRVTDEREHPQLTVRHWSGRNPVRFVLSHSFPIVKLMEECCRQQLQSLIVEGGRQTLLSFLERDLYDEICVEYGTISVGDGTPAPSLPCNVKLISEEHYDGNDIRWYFED
ncbi:MAG: bifunctional diaminohydroxyphosphoribosylaminopyrimidine deaminase/5-amino-6-(5-phosphoribosylamino)uracil reductase RibD [Prevotella sp.]|nr:bifunctional diaminohydroxyphosphoribosylaminopyrimidine deaminase/5-amino-6-(5-phosphoribosylamino)uracil reductase RibD [Prevotella sp.]